MTEHWDEERRVKEVELRRGHGNEGGFICYDRELIHRGHFFDLRKTTDPWTLLQKVFGPSEINYMSGIPDYMRDGLLMWCCLGAIPGDFLCAVIEGDLYEAYGRADDYNRQAIFHYVMFFYNAVPSATHRSGALGRWKGVLRQPREGEEFYVHNADRLG